MSFYVADVFGYIMTGLPLVCQCLRVNMLETNECF